jgi:hypothetical protein
MTTINYPQTFCDICKREIKPDEQYFRMDTMIKGTPTWHGDRQLKHCCYDCCPAKLKLLYKKIEDRHERGKRQ